MILPDDSERTIEVDEPVSNNLIPPILGLLGIALLACGMWVIGVSDNPSGGALSQCSAIAEDGARLHCYDQIATPHQPAKGAVAPLRIHPREDLQ